MKIKIENSRAEEIIYTHIKDIKFSPEADVTGNVTPIGQMSVLIKTDDEIEIGLWIWLLDDNDNTWCKYWITDVERQNAEYVKVESSSMLLVLDRIQLEPVLYVNGAFANNVIDTIFNKMTAKYGTQYYVDPVFQNKRVYGYYPKQSARERLQQVCFTIGAYIKTFFYSKIQILPVDTSASLIPSHEVFWRPSIEYDDFITEIKVIAYSYTQGTPSTTDEYVTNQNGDTFIVSKQEYSLQNPNTPLWCLENVLEMDLKCITADNVSDVLTQLSAYYFSRMKVTADVLNVGSYLPAKKVIIPTDIGMAGGWIEKADFKFGTGVKARIVIGSADEVEAGKLLVQCVDEDDEILKEFTYYLPIGYQYSIQTVYLDILLANNHRCVYYPDEQYITGTLPDGGDTYEELYHIALDWYKKRLKIIDVDEVGASEGVVSIT